MGSFRAAVGWLAVLAPLILAAGPSADDQPVSTEMPLDAPSDADGTGIRGVITDTAGRPLAEAGIGITAGTSPVPEMLWLSADDGSYFISLPAGTFSVSANRDGYLQQLKEVTVLEGETAVLDFQLAPAP